MNRTDSLPEPGIVPRAFHNTHKGKEVTSRSAFTLVIRDPKEDRIFQEAFFVVDIDREWRFLNRKEYRELYPTEDEKQRNRKVAREREEKGLLPQKKPLDGRKLRHVEDKAGNLIEDEHGNYVVEIYDPMLKLPGGKVDQSNRIHTALDHMREAKLEGIRLGLADPLPEVEMGDFDHLKLFQDIWIRNKCRMQQLHAQLSEEHTEAIRDIFQRWRNPSFQMPIENLLTELIFLLGAIGELDEETGLIVPPSTFRSLYEKHEKSNKSNRDSDIHHFVAWLAGPPISPEYTRRKGDDKDNLVEFRLGKEIKQGSRWARIGTIIDIVDSTDKWGNPGEYFDYAIAELRAAFPEMPAELDAYNVYGVLRHHGATVAHHMNGEHSIINCKLNPKCCEWGTVVTEI